MRKLICLLSWLIATTSIVNAQCEIVLNEYDAFDSVRTVAAAHVNMGLMIPSLFETVDGPKIIEQGKAMFMYSEKDSISSFFMLFAISEYGYHPIDSGQNVLIKLSDGEVIGLHNFPDDGQFDKNTNMRVYSHACVVPLDLFYRLADTYIEQIRINYKKKKQTIKLSKEQQEAIRAAVECVGTEVGVYPVKP
ncbi:MAG: hypothetical protein HRU41_30205 [Saprospiraceae bacterium]|nr:hypothetical protein [Saprospiraceae bacterium]